MCRRWCGIRGDEEERREGSDLVGRGYVGSDACVGVVAVLGMTKKKGGSGGETAAAAGVTMMGMGS